MRCLAFLICFSLPACGGKPKPDVVVVADKPAETKPIEAAKPTTKTVNLSAYGIRLILDVPTDVAVEPQANGEVSLKKDRFEVFVDRVSRRLEPEAKKELDVDNAKSFFGSEVDETKRLNYDKFERDGKWALFGSLRPGKTEWGFRIQGQFTEDEIDAMLATLSKARVDDVIRRVEQKQEEAAIRLAHAKTRITRGPFARPNLHVEKVITPELMNDVHALPDIVSLSFEKFDFKDGDLVPFADMQQIQHLEIEGPSFTDKACETIGKWKQLTYLKINGTQITGFGFDKLISCTKLNSLFVDHSPVRNSGLQYLSGLPIKSISLEATDVTDGLFEHLAKMPTLERIRLDDNRIEGKGLELLAKLPNLESLSLSACPILPATLKAIAVCQKLRTLYLGELQLASHDFQWLGSLNELTSCILSDCQLNARSLETIAVGPKLTDLHLGLGFSEGLVAGLRKKYPKVTLYGPFAPEGEPDLQHVAIPKAIAELPSPNPLKAIERLNGKSKQAEEVEGNPIVGLSLKDSAATDMDLAELRGLDKLESLDLSGCSGITDAGLAYLGNLKELRVLKLKGTRVTGDGFAFLKDLKKLTDLELQPRSYTTKQLAPLSGLIALEHFNAFAGADLYFKLKLLGKCAELREIEIAHPDDDVAAILQLLKSFSKLETLHIKNQCFEGRWLNALGEMTELRNLDIRNIKYTRLEDWKPLANLKELRELTLSSDYLDDTKLVVLRELANLEKLTLNCPRVTDKGVGRLRDFGKLHTLSLRGCAITDATMPAIGDLKELEELDLSATKITDAGLASLKASEELRHLTLGNGTVTGKGLDSLRNLTRMRSITLHGTRFVDGTAEAIRGIGSLIELHLPGCKMKISDVETILALPELRKLSLPKSDGMDIDEIAKKHPQVKITHD